VGTIVAPTSTKPALEIVDRWRRTGAMPPLETLLSAKPYPA
jgi:hypothetical protein